MLLGHSALVVAAVFTGAAVCIDLAKQPVRLGLADDRAPLAEWKPSYERGLVMQASLAVLDGLLGVAAWIAVSDRRWLLGAVLLLAKVPYTLVVIRPTNNRLASTPEAMRTPKRGGWWSAGVGCTPDGAR